MVRCRCSAGIRLFKGSCVGYFYSAVAPDSIVSSSAELSSGAAADSDSGAGQSCGVRARSKLAKGAWQTVVLIWLCLAAIRLTAPSTLLDWDQENPVSYVQDAVHSGNWILQRDTSGSVTSKPPLYTWTAALISLPFGRVTEWSMYMPTALATLGTALLLLWSGRSFRNELTGLIAASTYLLCSMTMKQMALARTDPFLMFFATAGSLLAYLAATGQQSWVWFWLIAAAGTLTKGPVGVVLAVGGLLANLWCRQPLARGWGGSMAAGIALYLTICGGWFLLAWHVGRDDFINKMIRAELVGHATQARSDRLAWVEAWKPFLYWLGRFAPWSLAACVGFWTVLRRPSADQLERYLERFVFCWFGVGLMIFSIGSHKRGDLVYPLIAPSALLGARVLARLFEGARRTQLRRWIAGATVVGAGYGILSFHFLKPRAELGRSAVVLQQAAAELRREFPTGVPAAFVDVPVALQIYLDVYRRVISFDQAAELLKGDGGALVLVQDLERLTTAAQSAGAPAGVRKFWELADGNKVYLVGNGRPLAPVISPSSPR